MAHEHTVHEWGFWAVSCGFLRYWDEWMLIISDHLFLGDFRLSGSKDEEARLFINLRNHTCLFAFCCCMCVRYIWLYVHLFAYYTMHLNLCYWHQVLVGNTSKCPSKTQSFSHKAGFVVTNIHKAWIIKVSLTVSHCCSSSPASNHLTDFWPFNAAKRPWQQGGFVPPRGVPLRLMQMEVTVRY